MFSWRENVRNGVVVKLRVLLGSHTYSVRDLRNGRRVCLSVPRQIFKIMRDGREISSPL